MSASVPAWVPALFLGLVYLGYRQSRPRIVRPTTLVALALAMFGLSLYGVVGSFGLRPIALLPWAIAYGLVLILGARLVAATGLEAIDDAVRVPGSWVPMALMLTVFAAKFALGFAVAVGSPLLGSTAFVTTMCAVLGALGGGFGARALAVHRVAAGASTREARTALRAPVQAPL